MLVQLSVDDASGELLPGAFATVRFETAPHDGVSVPLGALITGKNGVQVATVDAGNRVRLKSVTVAHDLGSVVQLAGGVRASDRIIESPRTVSATASSCASRGGQEGGAMKPLRLLVLAAACAGCAQTPKVDTPAVPMASAFKEAAASPAPGAAVLPQPGGRCSAMPSLTHCRRACWPPVLTWLVRWRAVPRLPRKSTAPRSASNLNTKSTSGVACASRDEPASL